MNNTLNIIAQAIGFIGTAFLVISYQQKKRRGIIVFQIFCSAFFALHFYLLGAYTGCAMNVLGGLRSTVYSYSEEKKWAKHNFWPVLFFIVFLAAGILTWKNIWSLLPTFAMCLSTISLWLRDPKKIRFLTSPTLPCWLVYNLMNKSIAGFITEIFTIISMATAIIRYDVLPNRKSKRANNSAIN
ncbi:MAG: YgjV family protein [Oscillospiraceae bacterium]|nr:YgjV family protein [Oscillospiraceae bacterium]